MLCEGQIYALCNTVGKENQAAVVDAIKTSGLGSISVTHNLRFMSSGEMLDSKFDGLKKSSIAKETGVQLNGSKTGSTLNCGGFTIGEGIP